MFWQKAEDRSHFRKKFLHFAQQIVGMLDRCGLSISKNPVKYLNKDREEYKIKVKSDEKNGYFIGVYSF